MRRSVRSACRSASSWTRSRERRARRRRDPLAELPRGDRTSRSPTRAEACLPRSASTVFGHRPQTPPRLWRSETRLDFRSGTAAVCLQLRPCALQRLRSLGVPGSLLAAGGRLQLFQQDSYLGLAELESPHPSTHGLARRRSSSRSSASSQLFRSWRPSGQSLFSWANSAPACWHGVQPSKCAVGLCCPDAH